MSVVFLIFRFRLVSVKQIELTTFINLVFSTQRIPCFFQIITLRIIQGVIKLHRSIWSQF